MIFSKYLNNFTSIISKTIITDNKQNNMSIDDGIREYLQIAKICTNDDGQIFFIGNGGSAGISSHMAIDYTKNGKLRSRALTDGSALTCIGNDIGFDSIFSEQLIFYSKPNDLLIAISSSGNSKDIINAVNYAKLNKLKVVTFSGFKADNNLRALGDINFYVNSMEYGTVEIGHSLLLHAALDIHNYKSKNLKKIL